MSFCSSKTFPWGSALCFSVAMSLRSWMAPSLGACLALAFLACAQDDDGEEKIIAPGGLAAQQCSAVVGCGCGLQVDVETCAEGLSQNYDSTREAAEAVGLEYDNDCAQRQAAWMEEIGCAIEADELLGQAGCALNCPLYHGWAGPGEECQVIAPRATTCAPGLDCVGGLCEDVCNNWRLAEGATCWDPDQQLMLAGTCVEGTHCDVGDTNRCVVTPMRGEPCPDGTCLEGDWCNPEALPDPRCEAIVGVGQACPTNQACETGYCIDDLCAPYPGMGEPCTGECAGDLYCQSGTCTVKQGLGQSCDGGLPCASGLSCDGDVCVEGQPLVCFGASF